MRNVFGRNHTRRLIARSILACGTSILCVGTANAACDNSNPATGETVTCATPDTVPVVAQAGSSNVTINITPAGELNITNSNGVVIDSQSTLTNDGSIDITGTGAGVSSLGAGNSITNSGSITSATGAGVLLAAGGTVSNLGSGTISGVTGVTGAGAGTILTNSGSVTGTGGTAVQFTGAFNDEFNNSGTISGNVSMGAGADRMVMTGGSVTGAVDQGDGTNYFEISGGTISGNVAQGNDIDNFVMTGGQIASLNQSNGFDTFTMSDGHIVGAFEDGDSAVMTGGRIGRVDMKLANNIFNMSGGTIDNNLVAGLGNDTIILSNGTIGGNISISSGTDSITITGGEVRGELRLGQDEDVLSWSGGGIVRGAIDMNDDNDIATLRNLTAANLATPLVDGGSGNDALTFDRVVTGGIARFKNWESVDVRNGSSLTFDGNMTLGDAGTGTGQMTIDSASRLLAGGGSYSVIPFAAGQRVTVTNAGTIDLTGGGAVATDVFTVVGNYVGSNGQIRLHTVLGNDSSPSDKFAISGGTATGRTGLTVINMGGQGAATVQNGILVVEALNGATTASNAFALNNQVVVGAYEYLLFKGGVTSGTANNWYLRSTLPPPQSILSPGQPDLPPPVPAPAPGQSTEPVPSTPPEEPTPPPTPPEGLPPVPAPPTAEVPVPPAPPTPGATPAVADIIPLYRIEVPNYAVAAAAAQQLGLTTLGTFHERQGDQLILAGNSGLLRAGWGRVIGEEREQSWKGTVSPSFDGSLYGFQAGLDLFANEGDGGSRNHAGVFVGKTWMDGDIRGFALGWNNLTVGKMKLNETSAGAYLTHIGPSGWYVDAVGKYSWFDGWTRSSRDVGVDLDGKGATLSLETGYPIEMNSNWVFEPQAQIIWQHFSLKDREDLFSPVAFDSDDGFTGRLGFRLRGTLPAGGTVLQPYLRLNMWHSFDANDSVSFGVGDPIITNREATSMEFGGGVVAQLSKSISLFATGDYTTNMTRAELNTIGGNVGVRISW